ncbi:MAG TPA: hypothetical protein VGG11_06145 [Xanthobacteraceae bacterium]|jgi:hypothetical protein
MTLSKSINTARHWLDRAAEVREIASTMVESGMKTAVLKLATDYDKLAERAERRTQVKPVGTRP